MSAAPPVEPLLRLRPLGLGEVLDDIFRVYRRHFGLLCTIALVLSIPTLLVQLASGTANQYGFLASALGSVGNAGTLSIQTPPPAPNLALIALSYLVLLLALPFTLGAVTWAAIALVLGQPVDLRSTLGGVARRYLPLMGLAALLTLVSPVLICLPVGIWLFVRWVVAIPAMLAEGIGPVRALDRSWTLTRGHWWRLFGCLLLLYLLSSMVQAALGVLAFPLAVVVPFVPQFVRGAIIVTITTAAEVVVLPVVYLGVVLLYFDLRIRHEHFDLDQLARQAARLA